MSSTTFEGIICLSDPTLIPSRWQVNKGTLVVGADGLTFQGRVPLRIAQPLSVSRVHTGAWANDVVRVDFAEGNDVSSVFFAVGRRGKVGRKVIDDLHGLLLSITAPERAGTEVSEAHSQALERSRQAADDQVRASNMQARNLMILGSVVLVAGLIVTGISYAAAAGTGGTYILAYGAMFVGVLLIIRGLTKRTRS